MLRVNLIATMATRFSDLCKYVGLPSDLHSLFDVSAELDDKTAPQFIQLLSKRCLLYVKVCHSQQVIALLCCNLFVHVCINCNYKVCFASSP